MHQQYEQPRDEILMFIQHYGCLQTPESTSIGNATGGKSMEGGLSSAFLISFSSLKLLLHPFFFLLNLYCS